MKFTPEVTVVSEVGMPGLSHIPISRGPMQYGIGK